MQRCPTCDFVYEEGQRYCDMDGTVLAHDPHELPRNKPFPAQKVRPFYRLLAICAIPNALLAVLLFYGAAQPAAQSSLPPLGAVKVTSDQVNPAAEVTAADVESNASSTEPSESKLNGKAGSSGESESASPSNSPEPARDSESRSLSTSPESPIESDDHSLSNSPEPRNRAATGKPANAKRGPAPKPDSKIENFIKKTGRMLKKPFKF